MSDQTPQQQRETQERRKEAQKAMNDFLHQRANSNTFRATRLTTRQELNDALRRAAGRDTRDQTPGDAA